MPTNHPKISVIIPVYNVAHYVGKCLSTLVQQTFRDFEIIAVNDGSRDDSLSILREFEQKYSYIKVIDQENQGMSIARNAGLAIAQGDYLCFVDSDDYVSPHYLEELYRAITDNDADIACCYYYYHFVESDVLYKYPFRCQGVFSKGEALNKLLHDTQIQSLAWNKIYRRGLFFNNGITFPTMAFEDMAIANQIFFHAEKVVVINKALYYYSQRSSSTLGTMNASKINDFIKATAMVRINLENAGVFDDYRKSYGALIRKTGACCYYYVLKMHWRNKVMRGCVNNIHKVTHALFHYAGKEFAPTSPFCEMPDVVATPKQKFEENYSTR